MASSVTLSVRSELIEYGSLPTAPWKSQIDSLASLQRIIRSILRTGGQNSVHAGFVSLEELERELDVNPAQTRGLAILLSGLVQSPDDLLLGPDGVEIVGLKATCVTLYLVVAYYLRTASRTDTADVWPADLFGSQIEPSSPMRLTARAWGRDPQPQHRAHLPSVRQHMAEHMAIHEALLRGFREFVCGNLPLLLMAVGVGMHNGAMTASEAEHEGDKMDIEVVGASVPSLEEFGVVSASQLDALSFVLGAGSSPLASPALMWENDLGSAMEVEEEGGGGTTTLLPSSQVSLISSSPFAFSTTATAVVRPTAVNVAAWLTDRLSADELGPALSSGDVTMASSPRRHTSAFNQLVSLAAPSDLQGLHKATVVRGEDEFPGAVARILDCHDCIIYALAPLRHALIACCTDCLVVVGAVGGMLRLERCERVQVISATAAVTINTCHDCILNLGVTRDPILTGDNRFVQLAPYNAGYERLEAHTVACGLCGGVSSWDRPLVVGTSKQQPTASSFGGNPSSATIAPPSSPGQSPRLHINTGSTSEAQPLGPVNVSLLPPGKLAPFVVPFRGSAGPLAGGPLTLSSAASRTSSDPLCMFLDAGDAGGARFPCSPWPVPPEYQAAWESKMASASEVRAAVKKADLEDARRRELMAAIQASFKDWLQATGSMRHVYDIARMERAEDSPGGTGRTSPV